MSTVTVVALLIRSTYVCPYEFVQNNIFLPALSLLVLRGRRCKEKTKYSEICSALPDRFGFSYSPFDYSLLQANFRLLIGVAPLHNHRCVSEAFPLKFNKIVPYPLYLSKSPSCSLMPPSS